MAGERDLLTWLSHWYKDQCDGDREHQYGVKIETIDNPGWAVSIDLQRTRFSSLPERELKSSGYESDIDWWVCSIKNQRFLGHGDPTKLTTVLEIFRDWIEKA